MPHYLQLYNMRMHCNCVSVERTTPNTDTDDRLNCRTILRRYIIVTQAVC